MGDLFSHARRVDFFQAVRLLERMYQGRDPVGGDDAAGEAVRFRSDVSLSFPPTGVVSIDEPEAEGEPASMCVSFLGVATPASFGSLPLCYAELLQRQLQSKDRSLADFFDLFNHRFISLFYRAWEMHRYDVVYDRSDPREGGAYEQMLLALVGLGTSGVRHRLPMADVALLRWAGTFARPCASAGELEMVISEYFGVSTSIEEFVPGRYRVATRDRLRLGRRDARLGRDTYIGEYVSLSQSRFRLRVGPLDWVTYEEFLPEGDAFHALVEIIRLATGLEFDPEVQLVLEGTDAEPLRLGRGGDREFRLGWTTWLFSGELGRDPADVILAATPRASARANAPSPAMG